MRLYGSIQCAYWTHPDIRDAARIVPQARELGAYLLTGPHSNGIGCYYLPDGYIMADLGYGLETVLEGLAELARVGLVNRCPNSCFVLVKGFLKYNPIVNLNVSKARRKEFEGLPSNFSLIRELASELLSLGAHWDDEFAAILKAASETDPEPPSNGSGTVTQTSSKHGSLSLSLSVPGIVQKNRVPGSGFSSDSPPPARAHEAKSGRGLSPEQRAEAERIQADLEARRAAEGVAPPAPLRSVGTVASGALAWAAPNPEPEPEGNPESNPEPGNPEDF